ncbi:MAG: DUF86 domain-containing protein [Desulfobacterales bacterium]|nr:DUF86 domain-containing protein [Desulfobacterales bacterium]
MDEYLDVLQKLAKTPVERFIKDKILIGSMRYYLQVSVEVCLDVANHVIASKRYRAPKDYSDSFAVLEEEGILPADLSARLRQMAKFRNRLVHLYGEIDDRKVHAIVLTDLGDIEQFRKMIIKRFLS